MQLPLREFKQKHLHGRGEDFEAARQSEPSGETPPRTWRRPGYYSGQRTFQGNTSTDVEKTDVHLLAQAAQPRKHLHGRGEDPAAMFLTFSPIETPPRTWRRLFVWRRKHQVGRNTSTDVEKTQKARIKLRYGEETPPRTWRRPSLHICKNQGIRNTSTDVEKTNDLAHLLIVLRKHLHGRGEDPKSKTSAPVKSETPPRTWRRP